MIIIPAMDIINGCCVRLSQGDYGRQSTYSESPLKVAQQFEEAGLTHLHLVDLDGARNQNPQNLDVLESIATKTNLIVDFGGGVKSTTAAKDAFNAGASQITAGSIAAESPSIVTEWMDRWGADSIVLGADAKNGKIATQGWETTTSWDVIEYITSYQIRGVKRTICTDISKDGMLQGPSVDLYQKILELCSVELIASGGVTTFNDLLELKNLGCTGAIVGKALYEGTLTLTEIQTLW
ncbi:MAG: 1-(5-phosphoribosyl)-5-[(5-phosphoribosylamino) methylideneamino]imidazole-4-carboxamide isomerase [Schleiferiaceae bacterium]